jgi:hypothetical protein
LGLSEKVYSIIPGEFGSIFAGLIASSLIGSVYFWPLALPLHKVRAKWISTKFLVMIMVGTVLLVVISLAVSSSIGLTLATSSLVLIAIGAMSIIGSRNIVRILEYVRSLSKI